MENFKCIKKVFLEKQNTRAGRELREDPIYPIEEEKKGQAWNSQPSRHNQGIENTSNVNIANIKCECCHTCSIVPPKSSP